MMVAQNLVALANPVFVMQTHWLDKNQTYDGTQLCSRWIEQRCGIFGDAIVAFFGKADVPIEHMVDLEDVAANRPIYSENMLHFIIEQFHQDLEKMVFNQRLFIAILKESLHTYPQCKNIERKGNDLYDGHKKLSVSIATRSPLSCLIHTGINISSKNTPVPTKSLADYDITPSILAETAMKRYVRELEEIAHATKKVRPVT